jgi:predicted nuclease of predicted toxin-antitoxin system
MRWLADECVHAPVVMGLRSDGHDVIYAAETATQTVDRGLAEEAHRTGRILLTEDRDFGELVFQKKQPPWCGPAAVSCRTSFDEMAQAEGSH